MKDENEELQRIHARRRDILNSEFLILNFLR